MEQKFSAFYLSIAPSYRRRMRCDGSSHSANNGVPKRRMRGEDFLMRACHLRAGDVLRGAFEAVRSCFAPLHASTRRGQKGLGKHPPGGFLVDSLIGLSLWQFAT